ncbi:MAG: hypothetical protein MK008_08490 [Bdellovibrionales bacterium]|nr:hypothetical protein [Bdellovibrionales bacterium]
MKTLLLTHAKENAIYQSLTKLPDGSIFIDQQIRTLRQLGFEPYVILDETNAEEILRQSKELEDCEIIYDTVEKPNVCTNLQAGLFAVQRFCFALPITTPAPPKGVWNQLSRVFFHHGDRIDRDIIQTFYSAFGSILPGYPLLITPRGCRRIKSFDIFNSLNDKRIQIHPTAVLRLCSLDLLDPHSTKPLTIVNSNQ